ncbi:MAG TPA: response regulator [Aggregatilineaceae bacterium]|nr:response regulator [Aggregatilineaceae bacterium]
MSDQRDVILIVDDDAETRTLLREQVFGASNFLVAEAQDGHNALYRLQEVRPDLIVLDLQLPGLSGRDLLVAVQSQGFRGPLIVIANDSSARGVVEAFRLGATDYVTRPIREAEVMVAVERGLAEVRLRRQRDSLVGQIQTANKELEARVHELTTLSEIGQSVTALRELEPLFDRILEAALSVTQADHSFLLLRDEKSNRLILRAGRNLRLALLDRMGESIQDPLADLVMSSREPLMVSGEGLKKFTTAKDLFAVVYTPLVVQEMAVGVLVAGNHQHKTAFTDAHGRLLKMLANYASIALVNALLFAMLDQRAKTMEATLRDVSERDAQRAKQLQAVLARVYHPLGEIDANLTRLQGDMDGHLPKDAAARLNGIGQQVKQLAALITNLAKSR